MGTAKIQTHLSLSLSIYIYLLGVDFGKIWAATAAHRRNSSGECGCPPGAGRQDREGAFVRARQGTGKVEAHVGPCSGAVGNWMDLDKS